MATENAKESRTKEDDPRKGGEQRGGERSPAIMTGSKGMGGIESTRSQGDDMHTAECLCGQEQVLQAARDGVGHKGLVDAVVGRD